MNKNYYSLGLMSGTSADGVDTSLIQSDGDNQYKLILDKYFKYKQSIYDDIHNLKEKINDLKDLEFFSKEIEQLEKEITIFHANAVNEIIKQNKINIDFLGFHGQTIFHNAKEKISKQLGNGKLLSKLTKKTVIYNFRKNDLDNGGQGAPLVPIFHKLISTKINKKFKINFPFNIINIGGITNITQINSKYNLKAYDIGPGNCLIDEWVRKNSNKVFDENGLIGKSGKVNDLILNQAVDNFSDFSLENSLDVKDFDISFAKGLSLEDGCATITKFSAYLIAEGLKKLDEGKNDLKQNYILCGGGRKNNFLIESIQNFLSDKEVEFKKIDDYEFDGDYIESQAFAYLAIRSYLKLPISFPNTTRCKSPTTGGVINKNF